MRKVYLLGLVLPAALVWACGGSGDDNLGGDGGPDATTDGTQSDSPSSNDGTSNDSASNDGGSDSSSDAAKDALGDAISISCLSPGECVDGGTVNTIVLPDSGVVCCGTIVTTGQQQCSFQSANTVCAAPSSCTTDFNYPGCGTDTVRLCTTTAECTEVSGNPLNEGNKCCSAQNGNTTIHFCANTTVAAGSNGLINCN